MTHDLYIISTENTQMRRNRLWWNDVNDKIYVGQNQLFRPNETKWWIGANESVRILTHLPSPLSNTPALWLSLFLSCGNYRNTLCVNVRERARRPPRMFHSFTFSFSPPPPPLTPHPLFLVRQIYAFSKSTWCNFMRATALCLWRLPILLLYFVYYY